MSAQISGTSKPTEHTGFVLRWRCRKTGAFIGWYEANTDGHYPGLTDHIAEARIFSSVDEARAVASSMRNWDVGGFPRTKAEWKNNPPYVITRITYTITETEVMPLVQEKKK